MQIYALGLLYLLIALVQSRILYETTGLYQGRLLPRDSNTNGLKPQELLKGDGRFKRLSAAFHRASGGRSVAGSSSQSSNGGLGSHQSPPPQDLKSSAPECNKAQQIHDMFRINNRDVGEPTRLMAMMHYRDYCCGATSSTLSAFYSPSAAKVPPHPRCAVYERWQSSGSVQGREPQEPETDQLSPNGYNEKIPAAPRPRPQAPRPRPIRHVYFSDEPPTVYRYNS